VSAQAGAGTVRCRTVRGAHLALAQVRDSDSEERFRTQRGFGVFPRSIAATAATGCIAQWHAHPFTPRGEGGMGDCLGEALGPIKSGLSLLDPSANVRRRTDHRSTSV
jgi:hypothetical protein